MKFDVLMRLRALSRWQRVGCVGLLVGLLMGVCLWPVAPERGLTGVALLRVDGGYALPIGPADTLFFKTLSDRDGLDGLSLRRDSAQECRYATAFFLTRAGLLATEAAVCGAGPDTLCPDTLRLRLSVEEQRLVRLRRVTDGQLEELAYYHRTHSVVDDGYNEVMDFYDRLRRFGEQTDTLLAAVRRARQLKRPVAVWQGDARLVRGGWVPDGAPLGGSAKTGPACRLLVTDSSGLALFHLTETSAPRSAYVFRPSRVWGARFLLQSRDVCMPAYAGYAMTGTADTLQPRCLVLRVQDRRFFLTPGSLSGGAPVMGPLGRVVGVYAGGRFVPVAHLCRLRGGEVPWYRRWGADLRVWWRGLTERAERRGHAEE